MIKSFWLLHISPIHHDYYRTTKGKLIGAPNVHQCAQVYFEDCSNSIANALELLQSYTKPPPAVMYDSYTPWWRHQMETLSALLAICARNSPVPGEFPTQRPVTRGFDVFFDLHRNKRLSKQSWGWWFETPSGPLWRHGNATRIHKLYCCKNQVILKISKIITSIWYLFNPELTSWLT